MLWSNRGTWFYLDDWDFAIGRAVLTDFNVFGPQNQNWHSTNVLVYSALMNLFGFASYLPLRLTSVAVLAMIGALVFVYARRRVGPWWALVAVATVMVTPGWEIVVWPFQMGQLISVAAGLAALLLVEHQSRWARFLVVAVLLVVAVASSSAGIPMVLVVLCDRLFRKGVRWQALVTLPALLAYYWWSVKYGVASPNPNPANLEAFNAALRASIDTGAAAFRFLVGLGDFQTTGVMIGQLLFFAVLVLTCWRLFGSHPAPRGRIVAIAAGLVAYWLLLSWGRANVAGFTTSPRYLFLSQILLVLLLIEVGSSIRDQIGAGGGAGHAVWVRPAVSAAGVLLLVVSGWAVWQSSQGMRLGGHALRGNAAAMRGQAAALALLPRDVGASAPFFLDPVGGALGRPGSFYFEGRTRFGPTVPAGDVGLRALSPLAREYADRWLLWLQAPELAAETEVPRSTEPAPSVTPHGAVPVRVDEQRRGACIEITGESDAAAVSFDDPSGPRFVVANTGTGPLVLSGKRYADAFSPTAELAIAPGGTRSVYFPADAGTAAWDIRLRGQSARVCSAPPLPVEATP